MTSFEESCQTQRRWCICVSTSVSGNRKLFATEDECMPFAVSDTDGKEGSWDDDEAA